jgi:hypothetical protein
MEINSWKLNYKIGCIFLCFYKQLYGQNFQIAYGHLFTRLKPCSRVILEKLRVDELLKKLPIFCGTQSSCEVTLCNPGEVHQCFFLQLLAGYVIDFLFNNEDGGSMFLRSVVEFCRTTMLHSIR